MKIHSPLSPFLPSLLQKTSNFIILAYLLCPLFSWIALLFKNTSLVPNFYFPATEGRLVKLIMLV